MKTLDLHGYKHSEIAKVIDAFIYNNDVIEFRIIFGNSNRMLSIVIDVLKNYNVRVERTDLVLSRKYLIVKFE